MRPSRAPGALRRLTAPVALLAIVAASVSGAWAETPSTDPGSDRPASQEAQGPDQPGPSGSDDPADGSSSAGDASGDQGQPSGPDGSPPPDGAPSDIGDQSDTGDQPDTGSQPDTDSQPPADAGDTGADEPTLEPPTKRERRIPDQYIVVYKDSVRNVDSETGEQERTKGFKSHLRYRKALKGFAAKLSGPQVARLQADPDVAFITPDASMKASDSVSLASGEAQPPTGVRRIEAASGNAAQQASDVSVAVIDTGIDLDNPDLNAADGTNCISPGSRAKDNNGHGTHVAGTIAARNNGTGVVGVAPGTKLYAVKVLDKNGNGSMSALICGIDWVTDNASARGIKVANLSLGAGGSPIEACSNTTDALHKAICKATNAGVTYVVAAGNSGWDFDFESSPDVPAAYPEVLTVTAASDSDGLAGGLGGSPSCRSGESDDRFASFSNYAGTSSGQDHTIAAPGVCIKSDAPGGGTATKSGTSMATPHIAGAVALCLDEGGTNGDCAGKSPTQIIQQLRSNAKNHTDADHGYGFTGDPDNSPASGKYFGYLGWVGVGDLVTPPPPTSSGATAAVKSVVAVNGTIISGGPGTLAADDGQLLQVRGGKRKVSWYAQFDGVPSGLSSLSVDYDGHTSIACPQTLSLYKWSSKTYVQAGDAQTVGTSDVKVSLDASQLAGGPSAYVSPQGAVRVLVTCKGNKVVSSGDLMSLTYQAP